MLYLAFFLFELITDLELSRADFSYLKREKEVKSHGIFASFHIMMSCLSNYESAHLDYICLRCDSGAGSCTSYGHGTGSERHDRSFGFSHKSADFPAHRSE